MHMHTSTRARYCSHQERLQVQLRFFLANFIGMGLTDGEGCERFWAYIRHVIASLRCSTSSSRHQVLTHLSIEVGKSQDILLPRNFRKSFESALTKISKYAAELKDAPLAELRDQAVRRKQFYSTPKPKHDLLPEDEICEILMNMEALDDFVQELMELRTANVHIPESQTEGEFLKLRQFIEWKTNGRVKAKDSPAELNDKLQRLFNSREPPQKMSDWLGPEGRTKLYLKYLRLYEFRGTIELKHDLWGKLVKQRSETSQLYFSASLRGMCNHFLHFFLACD